MSGQAADQRLELLLSRREDLASFRSRLRSDEGEDSKQAEELDRFISNILDVDEGLKAASKDIWRLRRFDREEKVRSLKQDRCDLSKMVFDDFCARWMTKAPATVDYWLEVALDLEGVLYGFSNPVFETTGPILDGFLNPVAGILVAAIARGTGFLLCLAALSGVLYFASGTPYWWTGWLIAAFFAWLIYRRAQRVSGLEREDRRWKGSLSLVETCVHEIVSRSFDPTEIARRLTDQERNGLYVSSPIFTMLRRRATLREVENTSAVCSEKTS
jgi:hypothetical protein